MSERMVILGCHHKMFFDPPPNPGDEVYCRWCRTYQLVDVTIAEWRIRCDRCPFSHPYGADESRAKRTGIRHVGKYPGHTVTVYQGDRLDSTIQGQDHIIPGSLPDRYHTVTKPLPN